MKYWFKASGWLLFGLALAAQTVSTGDKMHVRLRAIGEQLKCQCGCAYTVGSCNMLNCHFRTEVNDQLSQDIQTGASDAAMIEKMKQKYGTLILAAPPSEGFNLVGWVMPFVALVLGLIVIRYVLKRWRRPQPASASGPVIDKFRDQIEKELADLE